MKKVIVFLVVFLLISSAAVTVYFLYFSSEVLGRWTSEEILYEGPLPAEEGKCTLEFKAVKPYKNKFTALCSQWRIPERPFELKDMPKGVSGDVSYFLPGLGDANMPAILTHTGKNRLYVDTDGDGYLSDEKALKAKTVKYRRFGSGRYYRFGPFSVEADDGTEKVTTKLYAQSYGIRSRTLAFYPSGYRVGKIRLGNKVYGVAVCDGNFDGRYDKRITLPIEKFFGSGDYDCFAIDFDQNGGFDWFHAGRSEIMRLSRMVKFDDSYYGIGVSADGGVLELREVEPEFGTLEVEGDSAKMALISDAASEYISDFEQGQQLPVGRYAAIDIGINKVDSDGNKWTLGSYQKTGKLRDFEIRPSEVVTFKIGSPLVIKTTAERRDAIVAIGLYLEGQSGEQYGGQVKKSGKNVHRPGIKIRNESGEIIHSGNFEYG